VPESKSKRTRYTPPPPKNIPPSRLWVPSVLCALLVCGVLVVIMNYMNLLPGDALNRYLILGLLLITGGFGLATTYR
jgi:Cell division protein CrgA